MWTCLLLYVILEGKGIRKLVGKGRLKMKRNQKRNTKQNLSSSFWKWRCEMHTVELFGNKKPERYEWGISIQKNNILYINTCESFWKIRAAVKNQCLILFNACCIQVGHVTISQTFAMMFLEAQLFFSLVSTFVNSLLPRVKHSTCSCLVKLAFPPVWQIWAWHSAVPVIIIMAFKGPNRW